jgi:spoIIIJ-associated protein
MRSVEATAGTREDAIAQALQELGCDRDEIEVEVLEAGSKGLFGMFSKNWRVRVSAEHLSPAPERRPRRNPDENRQRREEPRPRADRPARSEERAPKREDRPQGRRDRRDGAENPEKAVRTKRDSAPGAKPAPAGRSAQATRPDRAPRPERAPRPAPAPRAAAAPAREVRDDFEEESTPITEQQGREAAASLQEIIKKSSIEATVQFLRHEDGTARLTVESEDSALLIGRKGRNLNALQYLINRMISVGDTQENTERLVVDIEGYVDRRKASLEEMALSMAQKAKDTGRDMRVKPLSPQERRIIHMALQNDTEIRTFSLGSSLFRTVIISPKTQQRGAPQGGGRSRRGGSRRGGRGGARRGGRGGAGSDTGGTDSGGESRPANTSSSGGEA